MLVRDFACAVCGAPRQTQGDAIVVLCLHCGAIVAFAEDATPLADRHAAGIEELVKPSAARARLTALSMAMAAELDRARWRWLAEEQILVMGILGLGVKLPADARARAAHVRDAVVMQEIGTFDPAVTAWMGQLGKASMTLTTGDPVAGATAMLAAASGYYAAIAAHPGCPPGALREGPAHLAREMVRQSIGGYASLLGDQALERIRVEVLGDERAAVPSCPKCGGPLDRTSATAGLTRCLHCGAVTGIHTEDAWTAAQSSIWQIAKADLVRRGELDGPTPVLVAVGGFIHTAARDVPAAKAAAFLRRAIPWLSAADLARGLDILATALDPEQRALLDGIRRETRGWQPDPTTRPVRPPPPGEFPSPTEAEEAAWIESALALFHLRRPTSLTEILAQPLSAMQVAAVHEQATGVSPRAALAFFERAVPDFARDSRAEMRSWVLRLTPGYDHPRVRAFLTDLAALLC